MELFDSFGRRHDYLRISLTDKCNFRCLYCMPSEKMKFLPDGNLMSASEIGELAKIFSECGVTKMRFTGGEPTLRKDLNEIVARISALNVKMSLTTNGFLLEDFLGGFEKNGLNDINISIDTIDDKKFKEITKRNAIDQVVQNINLATRRKFNVKLNVVVIRGFNDNEIPEILEWSADRGLPVRFIEYMPFFGNTWDYKKVFSQKEILENIGMKYSYHEVLSPAASTSTNYLIPALNYQFGIIPTISNPFCSGCSRIRLTANGKVKNCLFSKDETDLLSALRKGLDVKDLIRKNISDKKEKAAGRIDFSDEKAKIEYANNRPMVSIGG